MLKHQWGQSPRLFESFFTLHWQLTYVSLTDAEYDGWYWFVKLGLENMLLYKKTLGLGGTIQYCILHTFYFTWCVQGAYNSIPLQSYMSMWPSDLVVDLVVHYALDWGTGLK